MGLNLSIFVSFPYIRLPGYQLSLNYYNEHVWTTKHKTICSVQLLSSCHFTIKGNYASYLILGKEDPVKSILFKSNLKNSSNYKISLNGLETRKYAVHSGEFCS